MPLESFQLGDVVWPTFRRKHNWTLASSMPIFGSRITGVRVQCDGAVREFSFSFFSPFQFSSLSFIFLLLAWEMLFQETWIINLSWCGFMEWRPGYQFLYSSQWLMSLIIGMFCFWLISQNIAFINYFFLSIFGMNYESVICLWLELTV